MDALKAKAKKEMTNTSDIIRRALMNYFPVEVRVQIMEKIAALEEAAKVQFAIENPISDQSWSENGPSSGCDPKEVKVIQEIAHTVRAAVDAHGTTDAELRPHAKSVPHSGRKPKGQKLEEGS